MNGGDDSNEKNRGGGGGDNNNQKQLAQLEQDMLAKNQARESSLSVSKPGAVSVGSGGKPSASSSAGLSQLEQDIAAKQSARGGPASRPPGAVAISGGGTAPPSAASSNLSQLEQDILAKQGSRGSASSAAKQGLTQLEQDIAAKQGARGGTPAATRPGAVSASLSSSSSSAQQTLSQLEQDMLAKQMARAGSTSSATSNNSNDVQQLSHLERDIVAKQNARGTTTPASRPGAVSSSVAVSSSSPQSMGLSQLEQDIVAKQNARVSGGAPSTRPGVVTSYGGGPPAAGTEPLSQMEQDILAKQNARGGAGVATRSGEVTSSGGAAAGVQQLSQLEQDIVAKQNARGIAAAVSRPGAVASGAQMQLERDVTAKGHASQSRGSDSLSQLEQDVAAKQTSRGGAAAPSSRPGAVASGGGGQLTQLEQDIAGKTRSAGVGTSTPSASLSQLERDVVAKQSARGGVAAASLPGAMASGGGSSLTQFEQDIVNKQGGTKPPPPAAVSASLTQLERDVMTKAHAAAGGGGVGPSVASSTFNNHLTQLEQDVMAKQSSMRPPIPSRAPEELAQLEQDTLRKIQPQTGTAAVMRSYNNDHTSNNSNSYTEPEHPSAMYQSRNLPATDYSYPPMPPPQDLSMPMYAPGVNPSNAHGDDDFDMAMYPSDIAGAEQGGIEAFVAENVVDATGVAVLKSDEEEEMEVKRRQRKMLIVIGIILTIILVVVIVPVSLLLGDHEEIPETLAPSMAPSMAPSSAPTSIEIPRTGAALARYSGETVLRDPTSPQGKALAWIVNEDSFVVNEGLTFRDEKYIQRYIMAVFYYAMDGDKWETCYKGDEKCKTETAVSNSWLSEEDECSWKYLDCDQEKFVDTMDYLIGDTPMFYGSSPTVTLRGEVPQEFRYLTHLTRIAIPGMKLTGPLLSYVSNMTKLETLSVPDNNFTGTFSPTFVADHMDLTRLDLSRNQFSGKIPIDFENLEFLTEVQLEGNQFIGPIPRGLGLSSVELLNLQNNLFSGELPLSIYNARLKKLYVAGNPDLEGTIPSQIGNMTSLVELKMGRTALGGELPAELFATPLQILQLNDASFYGPLPETYFEGLTDTLVSLWLFNNNFEGTIPIQAITATTGLEELVLDGNPLLKGTIPASVCQLRGTGVGEINVLRVDCENIPCAWEGCCDKCY